MLVVDIDGVIADSEKWIIKEIEEVTGKKVVDTDTRKYNFNVDAPIEDVIKCFAPALIKYEHQIKAHEHLKTYAALKRIHDIDGRVMLLTARAPETEKSTRDWMNRNFEGIRFRLASLGENQSKYEYMERYGHTTIIEDRLKTANQVAEFGGLAYLVERKWNTGRYIHPDVIVVKTFSEAVKRYYD